jgi:hypothetical protein
MSVFKTGSWVKPVTIALGALLVLVLVGTEALAAGACRNVEGTLTLQSLPASACQSPIGFCASGTFRGDLRANASFTGSSLTQTVDTPATAVVLLTGDNTIQTRGGTLVTKDAIVFATTGAGEFGEVDTIVGGSGEWAGATGRITATGTFGATGGEGRYSGEICTP